MFAKRSRKIVKRKRAVEQLAIPMVFEKPKENPLAFPQNSFLNEEYNKALSTINIQDKYTGQVHYGAYLGIRTHFIYENELYMLLKKDVDKKVYYGLNLLTGKQITAKKKATILIDKSEIRLHSYYEALNALLVHSKKRTSKPIPYNSEINEYSDKWHKVGLVYMHSWITQLTKLIIHYYNEKEKKNYN